MSFLKYWRDRVVTVFTEHKTEMLIAAAVGAFVGSIFL